jgi:hypothetical protein
LTLVELVGVIRDVIVIIAFLLSIALLVGVFVLYRKLSQVVDSAKRTMESAEQILDAVSTKIVGPAAAGSGVAFGLGKAAAFITGLRGKKRKKGEDSDG